VVFCRTEAHAREAQRLLNGILERLGLRLNTQKTRIVQLTYGQAGFDFLGFHHRMMVSWRKPGHWSLYRWPSQKAMQAIRDRIKETRTPPYAWAAVESLVEQLNPVLRGWAAYFRSGNSTRAFLQVEHYVHERLALFANKQHQRNGRGWTRHYPATWLRDLGVFLLGGIRVGYLLQTT